MYRGTPDPDSRYQDKLDIQTSKILISSVQILKHKSTHIKALYICFNIQTFMLQYPDFYASISRLLCFNIRTFMLWYPDFYASIFIFLVRILKHPDIETWNFMLRNPEIRKSGNRGATAYWTYSRGRNMHWISWVKTSLLVTYCYNITVVDYR